MSSLTCPVQLDTRRLAGAVASTYDRVALDPGAGYHFNVGPEYAASALGYDRAALAALPAPSTARFAGVGNPLALGTPHPDEVVVDVGCGAGLDLLLAARAVGPHGRAIGVDGSDAMLATARASAAALGLTQVEGRRGDLHALPVEPASVDLVLSNGVLNLSHDKPRAFEEIHRVLRPGGRLQLADIVVDEPLSDAIRSNFELWAA
ncbi:MAG: methyltransferase domain-containing protein [Vicinamibacterales bacterium]